MGMVVKSAIYEEGYRVAEVALDDLGTVPARPGQLIWIGLHEPSEVCLRKVQAAFHLHDLAIEDALSAHQRPKIELYGNGIFVVLRTAQMENSRLLFGETHIFAGPGYVVTVRHGPSLSFGEVRTRCESLPRELRKGEDFVIYAIMDFVVDNYMPAVESIEAEVEELEAGLFAGSFNPRIVERIYERRRDLLALRRCVAPVIEMCARMMRAEVAIVDADAYPYFRDVSDHAIRVTESIDALREILHSALDANLLLATFRQNEVVKKLASWAAILAVPTAIAGIYGMNFAVMPELQWRFGYPLIVVAILAICGYLYHRFRRSGWL
jgi:magnesium transporter